MNQEGSSPCSLKVRILNYNMYIDNCLDETVCLELSAPFCKEGMKCFFKI